MPWAAVVTVAIAPHMAVVVMMTATEAFADMHHGSTGRSCGFIGDIGCLSWHGKSSEDGKDKHGSSDGSSATEFHGWFHIGFWFV
jgi:hypothetical protein